MLTIQTAENYINQCSYKSNLNEDEEFYYVECMEYLVENRGSVRDCLMLGGWYYERKQFDLALDYYSLAEMKMKTKEEISSVCDCLGYIYYYGRVGEPDYQKAFEYYSKASNAGNLEASMKVADMYRNGYYVDKDQDKYEQIIQDLYQQVKDETNLFTPLPEIFLRLSKIYVKQGKKDEAVNLLLQAKAFLAERIQYNAFFGNLTIMKWIICDLYSIEEFDPDYVDLFDLYYVLLKPNTIYFIYEGETYQIESINDNGTVYINYNGNNYENTDDFFSRALLDNEMLCARYFDIDFMEVKTWK